MSSEMDAPDDMELLHRPDTLAGERGLKADDFSSVFDLPRT